MSWIYGLGTALTGTVQLTLGCAGLGERGGLAVAAALPATLASLEVLDLRGNLIGATSAAAIAQALGQSALVSLDLSTNNLGPGGAVPFANAVADPECRLRKLSLSNNGIGEVDGHALSSALSVNTTMLDLDLDSNDLRMADCETVARALKRNEALPTDWTRVAWVVAKAEAPVFARIVTESARAHRY